MGQNETFLTAKEFASRSGLTASQVTKMLREKKIKGEKKSGKWMIPASELPTGGGASAPAKPKKAPTQKPAAPAGNLKAYSIAAFSRMTYLTETGVTRWLKQGRLQGRQNADGQWTIDAASLELPGIKHLLRP
jgi:hypothetical protein